MKIFGFLVILPSYACTTHVRKIFFFLLPWLLLVTPTFLHVLAESIGGRNALEFCAVVFMLTL